MKKKESIHQLQERLAQRLAISSQSGAVATWLAIELADERFLLPLKHSGEIFSLPTINFVAHAKKWFLGVSNLRGLLFGVVDFAQFLELPKTNQEYHSTHLFPFFYNMLAEGVNKQLQSRLFRIDEEDAFGLLLATAKTDTIGAITVNPLMDEPTRD